MFDIFPLRRNIPFTCSHSIYNVRKGSVALSSFQINEVEKSDRMNSILVIDDVIAHTSFIDDVIAH